MTASQSASPRTVRPQRWRWGLLCLSPIACLAGASWWFTAPLDDEPAADPAPRTSSARLADQAAPTPPDPLPAWPERPLDGTPAKQLLLDTLLHVGRRLDQVEGYTATFRKTERLGGVLGSEHTMAMKVRHEPFAVYFKYLNPQAGKEVVYAEGRHDNKLIAHSTGVSRWLVPRLAVPPDHPLAMAEARHSITEAGLKNLTAKLIEFRRIDLQDAEAVTILDRTTDAKGRPRLRSIHKHVHQNPTRPFIYVEVLYDVESRLPLQISNYDWPAPGQEGQLVLAERYAYDDLDLGASLSALDFDPANPAYAFHRY